MGMKFEFRLTTNDWRKTEMHRDDDVATTRSGRCSSNNGSASDRSDRSDQLDANDSDLTSARSFGRGGADAL
jgi:hypothetical protein